MQKRESRLHLLNTPLAIMYFAYSIFVIAGGILGSHIYLIEVPSISYFVWFISAGLMFGGSAIFGGLSLSGLIWLHRAAMILKLRVSSFKAISMSSALLLLSFVLAIGGLKLTELISNSYEYLQGWFKDVFGSFTPHVGMILSFLTLMVALIVGMIFLRVLTIPFRTRWHLEDMNS